MDISAGGKGSIVTGQDHGFDRIVLVQHLEGIPEFGHQLPVEGIQFFGPVKPKEGDPGPDLGFDQDQFIFHAPKIKAKASTDPEAALLWFSFEKKTTMKIFTNTLTALFLWSLLGLQTVTAQLVLPQPSPRCGARLTMGVTDIEVDYGSPGVNGRTLWGSLVPYDEIWRSGANSATWISVSTEVQFGGQTLKAGKYALYLIPKADKPWVLALNSNEGQWGSTNFKENLDVLRTEVQVQDAPTFAERLHYSLEYEGMSSARLRMHWGQKTWTVALQSDAKGLGMANVKKFFADRPGDWYPCANAAAFVMDQGNDHAYALELAQKAVRLNGEHFYPRWILAKVHAARAEYRLAAEQAEQSKIKGEAENSDWYQGYAGEIATKHKAWLEAAGPAVPVGKKRK
jgi:hypothetical protein